MAVIVKNTFLTIARNESCAGRRCQSIPPDFKPGTPINADSETLMSVPAPLVADLQCSDLSPRTDSSYYSANESSGNHTMSMDSCHATGPDAESFQGSHTGSCDWAEVDEALGRCPSIQFTCATPSLSRSSSSYLCHENNIERGPSQFTCATPTSSRSNSSYLCQQEDVATEPPMQFACATPYEICNRRVLQQEDVATEPMMQFVCATPSMSRSSSGYFCQEEYGVTGTSMQSKCGATTGFMCTPGYFCQESLSTNQVWQPQAPSSDEQQEPENEPETSMEAASATDAGSNRTRLTNAPAFQPAATMAPAFQPVVVMPVVPALVADRSLTQASQMDPVVSCLHIALVSCGRLRDIKIERDHRGLSSSSWVSARLHSGPSASTRSYDIINLARQSLEAITDRLQTLTLLSTRVQKEDWGYSLRSSIVCLPPGAEGSMCWDMFRKGHCPRRGTCRWYHPHESDIGRIKVTVRHNEDSSEEQSESGSSDKKHKISLGGLVE